MGKHFSIKKFNASVRQLVSEGYIAPTQKAVAQMLYPGVVIPNELKRGGEVMTYREALAVAEKFKPNAKKWYPYERYLSELKGLKEELGKQFTYQGFKDAKRAEYKRSIDIVFGEGVFDISQLSTEELRDLLNDVWDRVKSGSNGQVDSIGSASFEMHLKEALHEYGYLS